MLYWDTWLYDKSPLKVSYFLVIDFVFRSHVIESNLILKDAKIIIILIAIKFTNYLLLLEMSGEGKLSCLTFCKVQP